MTGPTALAQALADRYRIERELGQGGMATVYLAQDLKHDRRVAIKVLRPELAAVIGADRFLAEIKTTANLQHPHILPLHDSGTVDGTVFYVMPFVEGESLRDRLAREKQLPVADAVRIASEVASALDYAHRRSVIHRDIKPDNILLHDGRALVADFGIALAAATTGGGRMTETGMSLGTPTYMSPEQAMGERNLDARTDVYALGCVLYEMLAGEPPFTGPTAQAIVAKVMVDEVRPLHELRKSVPPHVEGAVLQAIQKLPADRFATAAQFVDALANPGFEAARPGRRATASGRRFPVPALLAGAVGLVAVGAFVGWTLRRPPTEERPRVVVTFVPDSAIPATDRTCCAPAVAISPDGRKIAYTVRKAGVRNVVIRDREGFEPRFLATDYAEHPFFSADGNTLGFGHVASTASSPAPTLVRMGLDAGAAMSSIVPVRSTQTTGATWLPDGTLVYGHLDQPGLLRLAPGAQAAEPLTHPDTAAGVFRHVAPFYVPSANGVLFTIWPRTEKLADARIGFVSITGGAIRDLGPGIAPQYTDAGYLLWASPDGVVTAQRTELPSGRGFGKPIRVAEGVSVAGGWVAQYGVARNGTLLYDQGYLEAVMLTVVPGGATTELPVHPEGVNHWDGPRYSPDGRYIAAAGSLRGLHQLFVIDVAGRTAERLTFAGQTEFFDWTPDGRSLVYSKASTVLAEQAVDRSGGERVLWGGDGGVIGRISALGPWIAFAHASARGESGNDILVLHRDSLTPRPYLATPFDEGAPTIAPDGRALAYVSRESGRAEVYVGAFPSASAGRQVVSTQGGTEPVWSRDGKVLYFRSGAHRLMARDVRGGSSLTFGPEREVVSDDYERAPDGASYDTRPGGGALVTNTTRGVNSRIVWILNAVPGR